MIKIGIIGYGNRIKYLTKLLTESSNDIKIKAIYDPKKESLKNLPEEIKTCDNYEELLTSEIDWVLIGSWSSAHKDQIIASFNAGKNVFCEKPIAITIEQCKEIKETHQKTKLNFFIGYPLRCSAFYTKIKKLINNKTIGEIISMEFNETIPFEHGASRMKDWHRFAKQSGGHLLEKCCHDIDIVNWLTNSTAKKVASFGGLNFFTPENAYLFPKNKEAFLSEKDTIDNQIAIIEYANNARATFHTNTNASIPERRLYICGTKGALRADMKTGKVEIKKINAEKEIIQFENMEWHAGGDKLLIQSFADIMLNNTQSKTSMDDAIKSAVTSIKIDEARKTGKVVDLSETWNQLGITTQS